MTFIPLPQKEDGGQKKVEVKDMSAVELLQRILMELQTMNVHLSAMTDEQISEQDIQGVN